MQYRNLLTQPMTDTNPLGNYGPFDDYILLREYLIEGGTIAAMLAIVADVEAELHSELADADSAKTKRMLDLAGMLRYGLCTADVPALDSELDKLRNAAIASADRAELAGNQVEDAAVRAIAALEKLTSSSQVIVISTSARLRGSLTRAFPWLGGLLKTVNNRRQSEVAVDRAMMAADIARTLREGAGTTLAALRSLLDSRFDRQTRIPPYLETMQIAEGKTPAYIDGLDEFADAAGLDWDQLITVLDKEQPKLQVWENEFRRTLESAYASVRPCLLGDSEFWHKRLRPKMYPEAPE